MAVPNAKIKIKKDGVYFEESVDRANYFINELTRAALRDVSKFLCKRVREAFYADIPVSKKYPGRRTFKFSKDKGTFSGWVRKKENDLIIGINPAERAVDSAYWFAWQELGDEDHEKHGIFYNTVINNIDEIRKIEAQYLSAIEDEINAENLVEEDEYEGGAEE